MSSATSSDLAKGEIKEGGKSHWGGVGGDGGAAAAAAVAEADPSPDFEEIVGPAGADGKKATSADDGTPPIGVAVDDDIVVEVVLFAPILCFSAHFLHRLYLGCGKAGSPPRNWSVCG